MLASFYGEVTEDLFCENVILIWCLVGVCIHTLPLLFCPKRWIVNLLFGSAVSCDLARGIRLQRTKLLLKVHAYWSAQSVPAKVMVAPSPNNSLVVQMKYWIIVKLDAHWPVHTCFLRITFVHKVGMRVLCVCVCVYVCVCACVCAYVSVFPCPQGY